MAVTGADFRAYQKDGVVLLRGAFADWVEALRAGIEALMASPSPYERSYTPKDGSARFFQDLCNWQRIPDFREFVERGPGAAIARALMGSAGAQFFHDHVLVKERGRASSPPGTRTAPITASAASRACPSGSRSTLSRAR